MPKFDRIRDIEDASRQVETALHELEAMARGDLEATHWGIHDAIRRSALGEANFILLMGKNVTAG